MAETTYYVLQEFELVRKRWVPKAAREVPDRGVAARAVERLRQANRPGIAFSRKGDMTTGDFSEPEIIASFNVPPEFFGEHEDL